MTTDSHYFWLGAEGETCFVCRKLECGCHPIQPECDGDFQDMECIEADGFITCHFSGPIRANPDYDNGEFCVSWGTEAFRLKQSDNPVTAQA